MARGFVLYAFVAGTAIAIACGVVGHFVVLRGQVFTGDALSHVAFTGALAALAFGFDAGIGLYTATVAVALALALLGPRGHADDVVVGSVFAWVLALGVLFLSIFTASQSTGNSTGGVAVLFGSIFGLDAARTVTAVVIAAVVTGGTLSIARPLLFASLDPDVARARGVPVRALGYVFLVLVGLTAAEATQAVGALLLLGLLAAPAGAAGRLASNPYAAMAISTAIAVGSMWTGLALSIAVPQIPPSFAIVACVTVAYAVALFAGRRTAGA